MEYKFVPTVGTECEVLFIEPGFCMLDKRWVLPEYFGPKHRQVLMTDAIFDAVLERYFWCKDSLFFYSTMATHNVEQYIHLICICLHFTEMLKTKHLLDDL